MNTLFYIGMNEIERNGFDLTDLGKPAIVVAGCIQLAPLDSLGRDLVDRCPADFVISAIHAPITNRFLKYSSGYGRKIPTDRILECADGRKRRVYCMQYSNAGSLYIIVRGRLLFLSAEVEAML